MWSTLYFCQILIKIEFSGQNFEKSTNVKFNENPSIVNRVVPCGRSAGRTDSQIWLIFVILQKRLKLLIHIWFRIIYTDILFFVGQNSAVAIATQYGVGGPRIESQWWRDIRPRPDRPWDPPSPLYNGYRIFQGGKAAGAWRWPPTVSNAEVKERVCLYFYSPYGAFVVCARVNCTHLYLYLLF